MTEPATTSRPDAAAPVPTPATGAAQGPDRRDDDWTDQVTDLIVDSVDRVRDRTTGPILEVARGSVHAVVAAVLLVPVLVLLVVLAVRVMTYFVFREVWITYLVLGTVFCLSGFLLWARRTSDRA